MPTIKSRIRLASESDTQHLMIGDTNNITFATVFYNLKSSENKHFVPTNNDVCIMITHLHDYLHGTAQQQQQQIIVIILTYLLYKTISGNQSILQGTRNTVRLL